MKIFIYKFPKKIEKLLVYKIIVIMININFLNKIKLKL
jgi:hypothetical protein